MAANVTMQRYKDTTQRSQRVTGTITFSGSYPTGGETLNLAQFPVQSQASPTYIDFSEMTATPSGATFIYVPGVGPGGGHLMILTAYNTQLAAGAYSSPLTGTTVTFEAVFPLGM